MPAEDTQFEARAVHPETGAGEITGRVRFRQSSVRFESDDFKVELPLDSLVLEWDPAKLSEGVRLAHPEMPGCRLHLESEALEQPVFTRRSNLRRQIETVLRRRDARRRVRMCGWFVAGFAAFVVVGWLVSRLAVEFIVQRVPVSYEVKLGEDAFAEAGEMWRIDDRDTNQLARMNGLRDRFLAALPKDDYDIRMHVVQDGTANAFALPGGRIMVTTGLLTLTQDDEEIAAILAHELAHVRHRHSLRQIVSAGGPALLMRVITGDSEGLLGALSVSFEFLLGQRFSRDLEREADESGWHYLVAADMDPRAMLRMMKKFQEEEAREGAMPDHLQPMNSHPATQERIERLERMWEQFPDKARFTQRQPK